MVERIALGWLIFGYQLDIWTNNAVWFSMFSVRGYKNHTMSELGSLYIPELKVYDSGMHSISCWFWVMQHVLWFQFVTCIHYLKFPRFLLIIFTYFQWTVGFYCYPKTEPFLLNCFLLPQIVFQCVLKCVLLNAIKHCKNELIAKLSAVLLMWFTALFLCQHRPLH